jgi:hypothetical protein
MFHDIAFDHIVCPSIRSLLKYVIFTCLNNIGIKLELFPRNNF